MAANSKAIGLLFEVAGGGNINGETGRLINDQLRNLVGTINTSDTLKLKFTIDSNHFKQEIDLIKKQLQSINSTSGGGTNAGGVGGAAKSTEEWKNATTVLNNYFRLLTQVQQAMTRTTAITGSEQSGFHAPDVSRWQVLTEQFNAAKSALDGVTISEERQAEWDTLLSSKKAKLALDMKTFEASGTQAWNKISAKANDYIRRVQDSASRSPQAKKMLEDLFKAANNPELGGVEELKQKLAEVENYINRNSLATETWYQKMLKTFGTRIRSLLSGLILAKVTTALRDIYKNVVEIDSAMTQLRIVTGASDAQMTKFLTNSTKLAKELGASIKDVLKSVETFSRLGYNLTDATILSEYTTIMSKVAAVSTEEATKGITAIIKGYGFDPTQSEHIADVLINVGQKYAVSASELMEAYAKAGAALNATNTSFEKSAGLIAAANASIQDASVVGTALKTVSARIRKSKTDLDDLGETADDLAKSWSVYAEEIEKLTGFNIMVEGSTTQFKDLYDIFDGLAKAWNNLGDEAETTQARVAEILGGTRQYQVISSILSNWGDAAGAYNDAMNSANVSSEAMATYMDSVEGRLGQLKATFEELSQSVLSSSWIKTIANAISGLISLLNSLLSVGDGILLKVGLWIAAIYALYSAWGKATVSLKLVRKEIIHLAASESILAKQNGVTMTTTELLTHATLKYMSTGLLGIITFIPRAVAALGLWIAGLFKAKFATDAATGSAYTLKGALDLLNVNPIMLAITGIVAAGAALIKIISAVDKAWKDSYDEAIEAAQKQQELIDAYDSEIDSLESLQEKLEAAHGDRQKLSQIYSELNRKVATSTGLLKGEESAYAAVNAQLQDRITAMKELREAALKERISQQRSAFASQKGVRYGGIFNWDWTARDASGETMRELMHGDISEWSDTAYASIVFGALNSNNGLDLDDIGAILNYEAFYEKLTKEQQNALIELMGFTRDSWEDYWDGQVAIAKDVFSETISNSSGYFSGTFLDSALERLIRGGYDLDETSKIITDLLDGGDTLNVAIEKYYSALESGDNSAKDLYQDIMRIFDGYIEKYPELTNLLTAVMGSIRGFTSSKTGATVELKSVNDILDEVQGGFDGISKALDSLTEDGYLTASALSTLADLESQNALAGLSLKDILIQDANGFKIAEDALQKYIDALIVKYTIDEEFATLQDKENAIAKLENLRRVLYTLSKTQATSTDATKAQKKALEDQKDALKDQLDAYKKLIDLRKELLQQYEDELTYKKELAEKERRVSQLQTQLAVSQLDTSAAGRAKSRQLSKDLKEAQEELDDFTLEHAIDVVTNELDTQYAEYENYIDGQIDGIEDKIDALTPNIDGVITSTESLTEALDKLREAIETAEGTPVRWTSYEDAGAAGFANIRTKTEFARGNNSDKKKYGTYQAYLDAMYEKYMGKTPIYHTGGIVGDMTRLKSTELFAKLLKGEFVATPQMMSRFMTYTLPTIASNGGNTEINAPLISIQCDNVTQESLPRLEEIVNEAVKTIKKQFDDGLGRAGYHKTVKQMI